MSFSASPLSTQTIVRTLILLSIAVVGLVILLPPVPAHAFENRAFGDVVVRPGDNEDEVSTTFGDVTVNGPVAGDVHSAFGDIQINQRVGGDVNSGMGDIEVRAPVDGEVDAGFGDVYVNSVVGGDVDVDHGDVRLGPNAWVKGDVRCSNGEVYPEPGSAVDGAMMTTGMTPDFDDDFGGFELFDLLGWIFATTAFVACSVLLAVLAPGPLLAAARRAEESPGWSLLFGVASVPAVIVLGVVLAISLVGIPLLLLLAPAYLGLLFFGALVAAYFVGRKVVFATGRYRAGNVLAAVVGAVIFSGAHLIPVLGHLILYALALLGTGAAILALISRRRPRTTYPSYEAYVRDQRDA
jgi:cytoskeletal protein CcmA (bactofilin family)